MDSVLKQAVIKASRLPPGGWLEPCVKTREVRSGGQEVKNIKLGQLKIYN